MWRLEGERRENRVNLASMKEVCKLSPFTFQSFLFPVGLLI